MAIDIFRIIAAVMVVMIQTAPFMDINLTLDFYTTNVLCRLAVPFFMMTSAYFINIRSDFNSEKLRKYIVRLCIIYVMAALIYLPIIIRNGDTADIIKNFIYNGTFYHLWYFPSAIFSCLLSTGLILRFSHRKAIIISFILYIIGMLVEKNICFDFYYSIFNYAHNGILYGTIFFVLGDYLAFNKRRNNKNDIYKFVICLILLFLETIAYRVLFQTDYSSMTFILPLCSFYLLSILVKHNNKRIKNCSLLCLIVYIIHPLIFILLNHYFKYLNSFMFFIIETLLSFIAGLAVSIIYKSPAYKKKDRTVMELNIENLEHNLDIFAKLKHQDTLIMAVVKADAYGHGARELCPYLNRYGIKDFAVATLDEGMELRRNGIEGNILVLGYVYPEDLFKAKLFDLTVSITSYEHARILNDQKIRVKCHLQIDTGMKRLGIDYRDITGIREVFEFKYLEIGGVYSHLCNCDSFEFTKAQFSRYEFIVKLLKKDGHSFKTHIQATEGLLRYSEYNYDYVRIGIGLYGYGDERLKPVMGIKSTVISVKKLHQGETLGYGQSYVALKDMLIGDVSIGYGDGYRRVQNWPYVIFKGKKCAIVGRICMDQLFIDLSNTDAKSGDEVILLGEGIEIKTLADKCNTIPNEVFSSFNRRIRKRAVNY